MSSGILTLKDVLNLAKHIETQRFSIVGQLAQINKPVTTRYHEIESVPFDSLNDRVGTLNGFDIVLDENLQISRMVVSDAFRRIQSAELVNETQRWMTEFFGLVEFPMVHYGNRIHMPSRTLEYVRRELQKGPM